MSLFDKTTGALGTAINMRKLKADLITSNIANAETPGFKAKKMDFEQALAGALRLDANSAILNEKSNIEMSGNSIAAVRPDIYENPVGATNNDGNTVDLEQEMSALSENAIAHRAATDLINRKLAQLRYVIGEGRG
jgi:flagellar basal-body rod protein FlgB